MITSCWLRVGMRHYPEPWVSLSGSTDKCKRKTMVPTHSSLHLRVSTLSPPRSRPASPTHPHHGAPPVANVPDHVAGRTWSDGAAARVSTWSRTPALCHGSYCNSCMSVLRNNEVIGRKRSAWLRRCWIIVRCWRNSDRRNMVVKSGCSKVIAWLQRV